MDELPELTQPVGAPPPPFDPMGLKFSDIVPKLTRGEAQRGDGKDTPASKPAGPPPPPEEAAAPESTAQGTEEKPELEPGTPIQVETEYVSAPAPAPEPEPEPTMTPQPPAAFGDADTGRFDLGDDAASFAEDMLERAIGAEADAAPHPNAVPEPAAEPEPAGPVPKSFGFAIEFDEDAPPSELAIAVSSALSDDPPPPYPEEDEEANAPADGDDDWLDRPAGPGVLEGAIPTHATETVDRRDTPAVPPPAPAPPAPAPNADTADIANALMRAADVGDTPPGGVPADELERLLSAALDEEHGPPAAGQPAGDGPALDPSQVAPDDFRGLAAGLIAELEASLNQNAERAPEDSR